MMPVDVSCELRTGPWNSTSRESPRLTTLWTATERRHLGFHVCELERMHRPPRQVDGRCR